MSTSPVETLELRAVEQRKQLHERAAELRHKIDITREKLDPGRNAREHFVGTSIVASAIALILGYAAAGIITGD